MELLILFVGGVIWMVIKSLTQPAPQPPPRRRPKTPPKSEEIIQSAPTRTFEHQPGAPMEVEELDDDIDDDGIGESGIFNPDDLVKGVIMAEVLGKPRSKQPHRIMRR